MTAPPHANQPDSHVPKAIAGSTIAGRFRYWHGRSGRRFLVSVIDPAELALFDRGVVILVGGGQRILSALDLSEVTTADLNAALAKARAVYVLLLARSRDARRALIRDVLPAPAG